MHKGAEAPAPLCSENLFLCFEMKHIHDSLSNMYNIYKRN